MTPKLRNTCARIARSKGDRGVRQKMWQAVRILREFTCPELAAVCEIGHEQTARNFICQLTRVGFFQAVGTSVPKRYRLVRNSGPLVPNWVRKHTVIYDPNTDLEYPYAK